jgi:hypothetical protein
MTDNEMRDVLWRAIGRADNFDFEEPTSGSVRALKLMVDALTSVMNEPRIQEQFGALKCQQFASGINRIFDESWGAFYNTEWGDDD